MVGQDVDRIAFADGGGFDGAFLRIRRRELGLGMDAVCPEEADVEVEPADEVQGIRTDEGVRGKLQLTPGDIADKPSLDELLGKGRRVCDVIGVFEGWQEVDHAGVPESFRVLMKEFQALGLDISIIDDDGKTLELKEIEEAEDKEDTKLNIDEIDKSPAVPISSPDDEYEETDEEEEDVDFEEELEEDLEMEEDFEEGADL